MNEKTKIKCYNIKLKFSLHIVSYISPISSPICGIMLWTPSTWTEHSTSNLRRTSDICVIGIKAIWV